MKIALFASRYSQPEGFEIAKNLVKKKHTVFYDAPTLTEDASIISCRDLGGDDWELFSKIDAVIIEGSYSDEELGFITASALFYQKPVLFLIQKGRPIPEKLQKLSHHPKTCKFIQINFYSPKQITRGVSLFLQRVKKNYHSDEIPSVKFTLRFTPSLYSYLDRMSRKFKTSKANFVRDLILKEKDGQF